MLQGCLLIGQGNAKRCELVSHQAVIQSVELAVSGIVRIAGESPQALDQCLRKSPTQFRERPGT